VLGLQLDAWPQSRRQWQVPVMVFVMIIAINGDDDDDEDDDDDDNNNDDDGDGNNTWNAHASVLITADTLPCQTCCSR
jgi:hypothetical protein